MGTTPAALVRDGGEETLVVNMGNIPSEDPHSYAHGFARALWNDDPSKGHLSILNGLSEAFKAGYRHGSRVRKGEKPMPEWAGSGEDEEAPALR